jgi:hypothetical protein
VSIQDFDNLAAAVADRAVSRRRALQMAAAGALGAVGLGLAAGEAQAATCPRRGVGCSRCCNNTGRKRCVCLRTVDGNRHCVYQCCPENLRGCNRGGQCGQNERCIRAGGRSNCCGTVDNFDGVCMRRCEASRPDNCDYFGNRC